jgi:two-component system sensor histidine kinase QseC
VFDLRALAQGVVAEMAPAALGNGVEIELDEGEHVAVPGNSELIRIALRNLVDNAVRYSPAGSRVQVRVRTADGQSAVTVIDQGPGLSASDREKVGQRFFRVLGNHATGSGLGLSITRRIVELHGGRLELRDNAGKGLIAELQLPLQPARPA